MCDQRLGLRYLDSVVSSVPIDDIPFPAILKIYLCTLVQGRATALFVSFTFSLSCSVINRVMLSITLRPACSLRT
jgi:phospholipid N-methyltransferase